jgi:hypothetical protein
MYGQDESDGATMRYIWVQLNDSYAYEFSAFYALGVAFRQRRRWVIRRQ